MFLLRMEISALGNTIYVDCNNRLNLALNINRTAGNKLSLTMIKCHICQMCERKSAALLQSEITAMKSSADVLPSSATLELRLLTLTCLLSGAFSQKYCSYIKAASW